MRSGGSVRILRPMYVVRQNKRVAGRTIAATIESRRSLARLAGIRCVSTCVRLHRLAFLLAFGLRLDQPAGELNGHSAPKFRVESRDFGESCLGYVCCNDCVYCNDSGRAPLERL